MFPPFRSYKTDLVKSHAFDQSFRSGLQIYWLFCWKNLSNSPYCGIFSFSLIQEVSQGPGVILSSCVDVFKQFFCEIEFLKGIAEIIALDLRRSTAMRESGPDSFIVAVDGILLHTKPLFRI